MRGSLRTFLVALGITVAMLALTVRSAFAADAGDTRWFGWVAEGGREHQVCGYSVVSGTGFSSTVLSASETWYQGFYRNPLCTARFGDHVSPGWLGAQVDSFRSGVLCRSTGWTYNLDIVNFWGEYISCTNPAGLQQFDTYARHRWWAYDRNIYAGGEHWSPRLTL